MISDGAIAAVSSAVGAAGRMIVRVSGGDSFEIVKAMVQSEIARAGARRCQVRVRGMSVGCWVYSFASPRSYTGEDLVELHLPGNPLLAKMALEEILRLGARAAEPGEFTARAFFNGRMDLSQAEGVAAVVAAGNQAELEAGRKLMAGELSRRLRPVMDELAQTLAMIEAEIDFSDQDAQWVSVAELRQGIGKINAALTELLGQSSRLGRLGHEPTVVLAGRPNAGKSSLLNLLARTRRAVVSPVAGTTRDALSASVCLARGIVRLVDVAGLEDAAGVSEIARAMKEKALGEIERADAVVLVREVGDERPELELGRAADLVVRSKIDLWEGVADRRGVSAVTGEGVEQLRGTLDGVVFGQATAGAELALSARHVQAISAAQESLARAIVPESAALELMAAEVRQALDFLGQVLGTVWPDDILGRIFATFCMGK